MAQGASALSADRFIRACQEDTSILTSLLDIVKDARVNVVNRMALEHDPTEIFRYQGGAAALTLFGEQLKKLVRLRDERAADKSPNGRI